MRRRTLALALVFAAACGHGDSAAVHDDGSGSAAPQPKLDLATVGPAPAHWTEHVPARVVFDETHTSRVGAPLGGRVTAVLAELGQTVKTGAPLVTVVSGDLADLYSARDKARVDLEAAKTNYDRVRDLVQSGSLPQKELVAAQQDLTEAQVALSTAEQKISSLKVGAGGATTFTITAPRDGVIVEKNVAVGQQVSPDTGSIIAIADLSDVWVVADLLEDAVDDIKAGTEAEVTLDGVAGTFTGKVESVAAIVDPDRHTVPVRVKLENPSGALRPNALAQIRLLEQPVGLAVPADALLTDGATSYVYVMRNGTPQRQNVIAGVRNASMVPIQSGLHAGDQVVAHGAALLDNQLPQQDPGEP